MPNSGNVAVKCEHLSDEEDNSRQLTDLFLNNTSHEVLEELAPLAPAGPAATPVCVKQEPAEQPAESLETLETAAHSARHMAIMRSSEVLSLENFTTLQAVKDEPNSEGECQATEQPTSGDEQSDSSGRLEAEGARGSPKTWRQRDMDRALDALRNHHMSLTKASSTYGIPSTTLWQRAHRLGIDTPKKEGCAKSWSEADLRAALNALRAGAISANKASKAYGIPSSTLYKIARREGIQLAAPFNAAPVAWRRGDLQRALQAIRSGRASVQRAATQYGIPTGTLYGRCKREGIELSRSNPTPWSEDAMGEALEAVRIGQMSINQAAIHFNLPYSSLYGRFKRCKYQVPPLSHQDVQNPREIVNPEDLNYYHQMQGYPEQDPAQEPYPHEFIPDASPSLNNMVLQDAFSGQTVYYNQNFSSLVTS